MKIHMNPNAAQNKEEIKNINFCKIFAVYAKIQNVCYIKLIEIAKIRSQIKIPDVQFDKITGNLVCIESQDTKRTILSYLLYSCEGKFYEQTAVARRPHITIITKQRPPLTIYPRSRLQNELEDHASLVVKVLTFSAFREHVHQTVE